jgi:hypothetical protein
METPGKCLKSIPDSRLSSEQEVVGVRPVPKHLMNLWIESRKGEEMPVVDAFPCVSDGFEKPENLLNGIAFEVALLAFE